MSKSKNKPDTTVNEDTSEVYKDDQDISEEELTGATNPSVPYEPFGTVKEAPLSEGEVPALPPSDPSVPPSLPLEECMKPVWPSEPFEINWPWGDEPNPQVGDIVGYNWEKRECAVVTKVPQYQGVNPWRVTIELKKMDGFWHGAGVADLDAGNHRDNVVWYTKWNRAGVWNEPQPTKEGNQPAYKCKPFGGKHVVFSR